MAEKITNVEAVPIDGNSLIRIGTGIGAEVSNDLMQKLALRSAQVESLVTLYNNALDTISLLQSDIVALKSVPAVEPPAEDV